MSIVAFVRALVEASLVVLAFPVAILVVGLPVALLVRGVEWLLRLLSA